MISWWPCQMKSQSIDEMQMTSCSRHAVLASSIGALARPIAGADR